MKPPTYAGLLTDTNIRLRRLERFVWLLWFAIILLSVWAVSK